MLLLLEVHIMYIVPFVHSQCASASEELSRQRTSCSLVVSIHKNIPRDK